MNVNKGNIKDGNIYRRFMSVVLLMVITLIGVFIGFGNNATVEAKTVLNRVSEGRVHTTYNVNIGETYKYGYLLYDGSKGGYLPDIKNLSKYGYSNLGWDIDTPTRSYFSDGPQGREFSHTVYPSKTKFLTKDGREYLRITGTAVAPQYFHMTEDNHRVAILTRENGNNGTIKLWEATLLDQTSSASFDYGFGNVYGVSDTRAYYNTVLQNGGSATKLTVRVSNDPYPASVRKAWGTKHANYYDAAYAPRFNSKGLHTDQVANLSGLGVIGHDLYNDYTIGEEGTTYILEYTGYVVDIPLDALITNKSANNSTYDFRILMTQTTPSDNVGGQKVDARVYGQSLQVPGFSGKSATTFDTQRGYTGTVNFKPSDIGKIEFTPDYNTMRALKHTSNFSLSHDYDGVDTSDSFSASKASPRFMGTLYKFGTGTWDEIRKDTNPEFVEDFSNGRGSLWVGWNMPSFSNNRRAYTTAGNAYRTMPPAKMTYTRNDTQEKPVIVRHRLIGSQDTRFTNPGEIFKTDIARVKSGGSYTVKPLTQTQLNGFSSTLRYTGSARIPADATKPATKLSTTGTTYTSTQLSSSTLGGKEALYVDVYYTGTLPTDTPPNATEDNELVYNIYHREKGTNKSLATTTSSRLGVGDSVQVSPIKPEGYKYAGNFTVDGASKTGSTYRIAHTSPTSKKVNIVFYYEKADMDYTVEYLEKGTNKKVASNTSGKVKYGSSYVAKPKSIYGYKPSGQYSANGKMGSGSSYTIQYDEDTAKFKLVFYYEKRQMNYTIEYRNIDTNNKIATNDGGKMTVGQSVVTKYKNIAGYTPSNRFAVNNGSKQSGTTYTIKYSDATGITITYYYKWNEPALTTKRTERDTDATAIPIDLYANTGIVTKRDSAGNVIGTTLDTNTSAILNPSGAPLGIALDTIKLTYKDASGKVLYETTKNTDGFISNNEFLNNYTIDSRIGSSSVASGKSSAGLNPVSPIGGAGYHYHMSTSIFKSSEAVEKAGLGLSNAKIGSESDDYLGRWVTTDNTTNLKVNNLNQWTPNGLLSLGASYTGDINKVDKVDVSYKVKTFNRMKHNYTPKVGGDGLEYYEYRNSEFLSGNYRYDASGNRVSDKVVSNVSTTLSFTLNASSLKTDKYVDADGFKAGSGKVNTVQTPVALEALLTFGVTPSGYKLETVGASGAQSVVTPKVASTYSEKPVESLKSITSYEEFAYAPYHKDDSLLTQQAVPVGGVYSYVNPYNSSLLPAVGGATNSVVMKSGYTLSEIVANAKNVKYGAVNDTDIDYNKNKGTGFYSSEKDNFSTYALGTVSTSDRTAMNSALTSANKIGTRFLSPVGATYNSTKTPFSASLLKYKQGFTVDTSDNEFRLDGRVAVGADTGFPIYKSASSTGGLSGFYDYGKAYKDAYKEEFGVEPSGTDKPMTTYDGSLYLVPLERTTNTLSSKYYTRLYVDGIGVSQMNFVDDNTLKAENYLYGRGDNTIYSGEREQVQYDGNFTEDQTIGQNATPSDTTHTNGVRTNNNSVLNKEVITDFKNSTE